MTNIYFQIGGETTPSELYLDIASLFVGEEYERQLQEAFPKMPAGSENEKIVLENFPENLIDIMVNGLIVDLWIWPTVYDRDHHIIWETLSGMKPMKPKFYGLDPCLSGIVDDL